MNDGNVNSNELILLIGRLDGKMDTLLMQQNNHDDRLRELEKGRWFNLGVAAAVSGIVSTLIALMGVLPR